MEATLTRSPATWTKLLDAGWVYGAAWILSRALLGWVWQTQAPFIVGDPIYYAAQVDRFGEFGIRGVLVEYPTPVAYLLLGLRTISGPDVGAYVYVFALAMLALDAGFTAMLWRSGPRRAQATGFWIVFIALIGPLCFFRFDLLPAVVAGGALLWAASRPGTSGGLIGIGAASKLWPALLIAPLLADAKRRRRTLAGFVGVGFGLALVSLVLGGWARLVSPLTWQKDRGLQIESVFASVPMMRWGFGDPDYFVAMSRYNAYEVFGPGTDLAVTASNLATVVGLAVIVFLCWRLFRTPRPTPTSVGLVMLAIVAIMIVTNKTLSPQYVIWLGGPLAAMLALRSEPSPGARDLTGADWWRLIGVVCAIAIATQEIYPLRYWSLLDRLPDSPTMVLVLAARNLALVALCVWLAFLAWRVTPPRSRAAATQTSG